MKRDTKRAISISCLSIIIACVIFSWENYLAITGRLSWQIYDKFIELDSSFKNQPRAIKDILLVTIDNDTLNNVDSRWPYPRSYFAKIITNLKDAGAKIIAFDFVFLGKSDPQDDALLKKALNYGKVILATSINGKGELEFSTTPDINSNATTGIITKFTGPDGVIRQDLTYMNSANDPAKAFLSWDMQILSAAKNIDWRTFTSYDGVINFQNSSGEKWSIPVTEDTKTFLIRYRCHTTDFPRLSFYKVLKGDFDPVAVKDKIVLIGLASSLFTDVHITPIGWLPGITLNANAFLTLYAHDFIKKVSSYWEWLIVILGVLISAAVNAYFKFLKALLIVSLEVISFFIISYLFLCAGFTWNYAFPPLAFIIVPLAARIIFDACAHLFLARQMKKSGISF
jgi:CHASE2 domain-containing sensor protein